MAGNIFPVRVHTTFDQKVSNFPDNVYNFDDNDNLTTLMKILLGNSGTGQLNNIQIAAKISQQNIEFNNLDDILGTILDVKRNSSEIYSFATNPFIDQLVTDQWQSIITSDASYRERLLGAAEAFQTGATLWGVVTLCEALTQMKFYVTESWRSPGHGRSSINNAQEIVLIPLIGGSLWSWNQQLAQAVLSTAQKLIPCNFIISFGTPIQTFTQVSGSYVTTTNGYSEYFHLETYVNANQINPPGNILPGANSRYWVQNNATTLAPNFAHLQTQETIIDMTGNIAYCNSTDTTGYPANSIANLGVEVTSTIYGAQ